MDATGWSTDLPRIPGYYWVRLPGYERAPTIAEIELHDSVLEIMHEGMDGPRGWVPSLGPCPRSSRNRSGLADCEHTRRSRERRREDTPRALVG